MNSAPNDIVETDSTSDDLFEVVWRGYDRDQVGRHIRDLQLERDELLREVARLRDETRRATAEWLPRGMKGPRRL